MSTVPLQSFCVAAALANEQGDVIQYNRKYQALVLTNGPAAGDQSSEENKGETAAAAENPNKNKSIWELVQETKETIDNALMEDKGDDDDDATAWSKTLLLWQGANVPSKWVRANISKLSSESDDARYLLQIEDVDGELRAKDQWSAILETTFDGFWDYHIDKDYEYMSPRFWEMFGYEAHEKQHKPSEWMDMVHPDDFKESMKDLQAHFQSKGQVPYQRETRYKHKNGQDWIWVNCRGKVIEWHPETGAPLRMVGTHTDITEAKIKQEREQELLRVEERYKAEQQLQDFVAHEIRNPLAAAMSATQFLQDGIIDADESKNATTSSLQKALVDMKDDANTISESLDYIHQLLTSMLDLNTFLVKGSGAIQITPRPWRLKHDVLEPVFQLYKHRAHSLQFTFQTWHRNKGHLQLLPPDKDEMINVDMLRLKQVLINLISNAIKFTKEGFVRVQVGRFQADKTNRLTILVEDSGSGVPADKRHLLFEKYVRLSTQIPGSGIGLALTKLLVEAMNGTIVVDEAYQSGIPGNPGSRFVVELDVPLVGGDSGSLVDAKEPSTSVETPNNNSRDYSEQASSSSLSENSTRKQSRAASTEMQNSGSASNEKTARLSVQQSYPPEAADMQNKPQRNNKENGYTNEDVMAAKGGSPKDETAVSVVTEEVQPAGNDEEDDGGGLRPNVRRVLVVDDDRLIRKLLTRRFKKLDSGIQVDTAESGEVAISKIKNEASDSEDSTDPAMSSYDLVVMDHYMPLAGGQLTGEETIKIIRPYLPKGIIVGSSGNDVRKQHTEAGADLFWMKPVPKDEVLVEDLKEAFRSKQQDHQESESR